MTDENNNKLPLDGLDGDEENTQKEESSFTSKKNSRSNNKCSYPQNEMIFEAKSR